MLTLVRRPGFRTRTDRSFIVSVYPYYARIFVFNTVFCITLSFSHIFGIYFCIGLSLFECGVLSFKCVDFGWFHRIFPESIHLFQALKFYTALCHIFVYLIQYCVHISSLLPSYIIIVII